MQTISYVILTWNSEKTITACLVSIHAMQGFAAQVVIVDNGSSDNTVRLVEETTSRLGMDLHLIRLEENRGTTISRNLGFASLKTNYDYICVLDSDTELNEPAMGILTEALAADANAALVGPKLLSMDGAPQVSARNFPTLPEKLCKAIPLRWFQQKGEAMESAGIPMASDRPVPVDYLMSACWLLRSGLIDEIGPLDERIFYAPEDAEFCIRIAKAGYKTLYCPSATILHHWQRISRKKHFSRHNWEHIKGLAHMFKKHGYLFSAVKIQRGKTQ